MKKIVTYDQYFCMEMERKTKIEKYVFENRHNLSQMENHDLVIPTGGVFVKVSVLIEIKDKMIEKKKEEVLKLYDFVDRKPEELIDLFNEVQVDLMKNKEIKRPYFLKTQDVTYYLILTNLAFFIPSELSYRHLAKFGLTRRKKPEDRVIKVINNFKSFVEKKNSKISKGIKCDFFFLQFGGSFDGEDVEKKIRSSIGYDANGFIDKYSESLESNNPTPFDRLPCELFGKKSINSNYGKTEWIILRDNVQKFQKKLKKNSKIAISKELRTFFFPKYDDFYKNKIEGISELFKFPKKERCDCGTCKNIYNGTIVKKYFSNDINSRKRRLKYCEIYCKKSLPEFFGIVLSMYSNKV